MSTLAMADREGGGDLGSLVFEAASCSGGDASLDAALDFCAALLQGPRLAARESAGRLLSLEGGHQAATQVILDVCPRADPSFLDRSPHVLDVIKTFPEPWDDGLVEVFQRRTMMACSSDREGFSRGTWAHRRSGPAGEPGRPVKTEHVTLHSSINMLEGNTGCHCWEAAFVLYEFVRSTSESFRNKLCLELGAGCGLVGVGLRRAGARTAVLTDANEDTLVNLAENLELNGIEPRSVDVSLGLKALGDGEVCYGRWCWEDEIADSSLDVDVVLGSVSVPPGKRPGVSAFG